MFCTPDLTLRPAGHPSKYSAIGPFILKAILDTPLRSLAVAAEEPAGFGCGLGADSDFLRVLAFWHAEDMQVRLAVAAVIAVAVSAGVLAAAPAVMKALDLRWAAWPLALAGGVVAAVAALARPLTAVVTRSWADRAQEQLSGRSRARQVEHDVSGRGKGLPVAAEVTDRAVLGIHPAIPLPASADPSLPEELPLYVRRDVDDDLRAWIAARRGSGGFLLIVGPAAAGKTRTAHQLIQDMLPSWPLLMPASAEKLTAYIHAAPEAGDLVIWLDELQNYLGPGGLSAALIRRILIGPQPVIIIGTIWPHVYDTLTTPPARSGDSPTAGLAWHELGGDVREILATLPRRIDLQPSFTAAEQDRARAVADRDPRIAEALAHGRNLPETLAAAPDLIRRWIHAADPYGAAVITAAVTARRCGHRLPLPPAVLLPLAQHALTPEQRAHARPDWFQTAVHWARMPVRGTAAPLLALADKPAVIEGFSVSDILVQHAVSDSASPWHRIPDEAWLLLIDHAAPAACLEIAAAAYPHRAAHQALIAYRAARKAADAGNPAAMNSLGIGFQEQGHTRQAEQWYRKGARAGDPCAMANLGFLFAQRGETGQAERWYRKAAAAGHFGAMSALAVLLAEQGDAGQAEEWHRKAARAGQIITAPAQHQDNAGDAEQRYRGDADAGDLDAMAGLANLLHHRGDNEEAEHWYRKAAEAGHRGAMNNLGILLSGQDRNREAEHWYRKVISTGGSSVAGAMFNLGVLFDGEGRTEDAEQWYRRSAAFGHTAAMTHLGVLLTSQGHPDEARQWFRKAAAAGDTDARHKEIQMLKQQGHADETEE